MMKEMSGSLDFPSGVGTQMTIASASPSESTVDLTTRRLPWTRAAKSPLGTSSIGLTPAPIRSARLGSASTPITEKPVFAKATASGRPTYPRPMMPTVAVRLSSRSLSSVAMAFMRDLLAHAGDGLLDGFRRAPNLVVGQLGIARQAQHLGCGLLRAGARARPLRPGERGLGRDDARIMDGGANAELAQRGGQGIALARPHGELVVDMPCRRPLDGQREGQARQQCRVAPGDAAARIVPLGQPLELDAQEGRLQLVEPARVAQLHVRVLAGRAVVAQETHPLGHIVARGEHHAAVAAGAEVLGLIE